MSLSCNWTQVHMPSTQESWSPRPGMCSKERVYWRGIQTKRQGEGRPQICLPKGFGLHVFKDKGSECRVYTLNGICWLDVGRKEVSSFSEHVCAFRNHVPSWAPCSLNGSGSMICRGEADLRVCHHRGYFHSLLVLSAQLQKFFPICSRQSRLLLLVMSQLLQNNPVNRSFLRVEPSSIC